MMMNLVVVVRGAKGVTIEDESGKLVTDSPECIGELWLTGNPKKLEEDGDDVYRTYEVDVEVSGKRRRGCPPAPRSYSDGGDPGEPASIEDLRVEVRDCPGLSAALAGKYQDLFVEALLKEGRS